MSEPEDRRFKLIVAYDGRPFEGWQSQPSGETIQDHLLRSLQIICPAVNTVQGSGRTDAGVHALAQVAHFDVPADWRMQGTDWVNALNTKLPRTIRVMDCEETTTDFHARFSAQGKTYRYELFMGPVLPPLRSGLAWHLRHAPDLDFLRAATNLFLGEHDFASFAANRGSPELNPEDTNRHITQADLEVDGDDLRLTFSGNGFLYKMVRLMTGAIVRCGQGGIELEEVRELIDQPDGERKSPLAAPPDGLYLVSVHYGDSPDAT